MAELRGWIESQGNGYRARLRFPDGTNPPSKSFPLKRDAKVWLDTQMASYSAGTFVDERKGRVPFSEWAERWLETRVDLRHNSKKRYRNEINVSFNPYFGERTLISIGPLDVQRWLQWEMERGSADTTVHTRAISLTSIFEAAVDAELLKRNPCKKLKKPAYVPRRKPRLLTVDEVTRLAESIGDRYRALVWLGATGGLRISELGAVRPTSLDQFRVSVSVQEQLQINPGNVASFVPVKTKAGVRRVRLPAAVMSELQDHIRRYNIGPDSPLFSSGRFAELRPNVFTANAFHTAAAKAGLEPLVPHDLRHTAVSWWIRSGANPKEIQRMAGHSSIKVTFDTYGHLFDDHDEHLVANLESMIQEVEPQVARLRLV